MTRPAIVFLLLLGVFTPLASGANPKSPFDQYLENPHAISVSDGFDFPLGDANGTGSYRDIQTRVRYKGWYVALSFGQKSQQGIHPGEDWNGSGGSNTDLGQNVHAVSTGKVVFAQPCGSLWGNVVMIDHLFYENHHRKRIRSVYAHLHKILVQPGQTVHRRQVIGTLGQDPEKLYLAHLHFELRWNVELPATYWPSSEGKDLAWLERHYTQPSQFIKDHRSLFVPPKEAQILLIHQETYQMRLVQYGKVTGEYKVALGQEPGRKRKRGDNRTPKGMYFVIDKQRGNFSGKFGSYFGGHWIKINYPNLFDATWGLRHNLISPQQRKKIAQAWNQRLATLGNTRLGGGIGFHGWIEEWLDAGSRHLSWGCIVLHNYDIKKLYDKISLGTMVVIF